MKRNSIISMTTIIAGSMAVMMAAAVQVAAVNELISSPGSDVDARDERGYTALHYAAAHGNTEQVQVLVDAGADVNARGANDNTALILAAQEGHTDVVEILIESGASIEAQNEFGGTAFAFASGRGHRDVVDHLMPDTQVQEVTLMERVDVWIAGIALIGIWALALRMVIGSRQADGSFAETVRVAA